MKEVNVKQLKKLMDEKADFQLIDVREPNEVEQASIGGLHIPMGNMADNVNKVEKGKQVIVYCRSGRRSGTVVEFLERKGFDNTYNLAGGILAWKAEFDPSLNVS